MLEPANKRRFDRFSLSLPVECRSNPGQEDEVVLSSRTENLSLSGLKLNLGEHAEFKVGDSLELEIDTLRPDGLLLAKGLVRWIGLASGAAKERVAGVELTSMRPTDWSTWFQILPWI